MYVCGVHVYCAYVLCGVYRVLCVDVLCGCVGSSQLKPSMSFGQEAWFFFQQLPYLLVLLLFVVYSSAVTRAVVAIAQKNTRQQMHTDTPVILKTPLDVKISQRACVCLISEYYI